MAHNLPLEMQLILERQPNRPTTSSFLRLGTGTPYDLRQNSSALLPPEYYVNYLSILEVMGEISTETTCPDAPYDPFVGTGDDVA